MSRASQVNRFVGVNYIPDNVRMEVPPQFFLQRFYDFDAMLVIMPSRRIPFAYVVARRKQFSKGLTDKAVENAITQPDTVMCFQNGCVPVCLMYKTGATWNPDPVLAKLAARDMWRIADEMGTNGRSRADVIADMLEAQEEADKKKIDAEIRDDIWNRSGDAWRSYQARTGQRNKLSTPQQEQRTEQIAPSTSSSTETSGSSN